MDNDALIEAKVNELIDLLRKNPPDRQQSLLIRERLNNVLNTDQLPKSLEAFRELDGDMSRMELIDDLELLLSQHQFDSSTPKRMRLREKLKKSVVVAIGLVMIMLGMGMIIMPAPPNFEMFTLFYFNKDDGVTIMDVISLLIILTGVYLIISMFIKKNPNRHDDA